MAKESVLSGSERESIEIIKFIFHIIIKDDEEPHYLDEVVLTDSQQDFFRKRFIDASYGTQFNFINKEVSQFVEVCKELINNTDSEFIKMSRKLAYEFHTHHSKGSISDGIFIIALVTISNINKLIFLIKMDHQKVLHYRIETQESVRRAIMEEIGNSLVEDKAALQKVAIIDISDHFAWDVLAYERKRSEGIADYFKKFLGVVEREEASKLTRKAVNTVTQWARANKDKLPVNEEVANYKDRAIKYMETHDSFDTDEYLNMVVKDEDDERKKILIDSLKETLSQEGITGQRFRPKPNSLSSSEKKNIRKTEEGVTIEWKGSANRMGIVLPNEPNPEDDLYHITIKTRHYDIVK